MSPEPVAARAGRVIRGRVASRASALSFPTIEAVPPDSDAGNTGSPTLAHVETRRVPSIDPAELDRARLEASARGYADGLAAGRDEAIAEVHERARELLKQLEAAVQAQRTAQMRAFDELSGDVARFAYATVDALLGRELALAQNPVRDAVEHALRFTPDRASALVLVHPDDIDLVGPVGDLGGTRAVEVLGDAAVQRGGCVVRAGDCEVDAQIDAALERVRDLLS
jgi:flagellar assembly protein FliH